jgi:hypothetical protein
MPIMPLGLGPEKAKSKRKSNEHIVPRAIPHTTCQCGKAAHILLAVLLIGAVGGWRWEVVPRLLLLRFPWSWLMADIAGFFFCQKPKAVAIPSERSLQRLVQDVGSGGDGSFSKVSRVSGE